jgi:thiol:disulfide interchange protein
MPGLPQPKTKAEFDQVLADAKGLVAVDFTATWCVASRSLASFGQGS